MATTGYWSGVPLKPQARGYDAAYAGVPNWDIGRPQRAFVLLAEAGAIGHRVLEVGCGTGELSLFLARRGHEVLGIDFSPRAIAAARAKAKGRWIDAHFLVWDVLELDDLGLTVDTVVDSALLHCLDEEGRRRFVDGLGTVLTTGGRYLVQVDAKPDGTDITVPGVSRQEFRALFRPSNGWRIDFIAETTFERTFSRNLSFVAAMTRVGPGTSTGTG